MKRILEYLFAPILEKLDEIRCGLIDVEAELKMPEPVNTMLPRFYELMGKRCAVVFDLPSTEWPIEGSPAWVYIIDIEMPLIYLSSLESGKCALWVNVNIIKTIGE